MTIQIDCVTLNFDGKIFSKNFYLLDRVWILAELYDQADEWIKRFDKEDASWCFASGWTSIGSVKYPSKVYFKYEQDYLMFKLKFGKLLKF